ncbi:MAG: 2-succinyl-5-enolpyruvyl-6-hydroxy-3-cyclohexene-1-carboxylic-acid synthase [Muribaculaceae bacterium]|nr:2-succinyl-5-enolpyruvyl-6-hydroxy-3-cyclohexene-1-carboxylic-acid synthase [Muribaculaceae bacterium]
MINTSNVYCRQIVGLLLAYGVRTAYCSPGSRNAPLLIALDACDEIIKHVVVDERSAAFQAYGCALIEQRPVAIVCTSGTAVLDYAPAVAEAYYSGVPLIVVSADRPREWIDQDDSQTIRQFGVLSHIVKGSYDVRAIPEGSNREYSDDVKWTVNRTVNEAMLKALEGKPGPVHINVQLAEPLGELTEKPIAKERSVTLVSTSESLSSDTLKFLAHEVASSKIMLVAGFSTPDNNLNRSVRMFSSLPNVIVMAETLANLHDPQPMSTMIDSVLCDMSAEDKEKMRPDIVISMGGALVSRMLKQYLRDYPPHKHWSLGYSNYFCDCFKSLTHKIEISPAPFLRQLYGAIKKSKAKIDSDYFALWYEYRIKSSQLTRRFIDNSQWSDLKALDFILNNLKLDNLFVSNGTIVRYSQLLPHLSHAEYGNRGVSGIDGSTSTAVGAAWAYSGKTTLLSGDISWLYDSGASALNDIPLDMRMIVISNSGGGIFRFIKTTSDIPQETRERYFCVENLSDLPAIAEGYGIEAKEAHDMNQLKERIEWLSEDSDLPRMLVVVTPPEESAEILSAYFTKNQK